MAHRRTIPHISASHPLKPLLLCGCALVLACALPAKAHAQLFDASIPECPLSGYDLKDNILRDSLGYQLALLAKDTTTKTYGAVSVLEEQMRWDDAPGFQTFIYASMGQYTDIAKIPMTHYSSSCPGIYHMPFGVYHSNYVLAFRQQERDYAFTFFYSGSIVASTYAPLIPLNEDYGAVISAGLMAPILAPLLVFGNENAPGEIDFVEADFIIGAEYDSDYLGVALGYVGTNGLYWNVDQDKLWMFLQGTLQDQGFGWSVPYLKFGFKDVDWSWLTHGDRPDVSGKRARKRPSAARPKSGFDLEGVGHSSLWLRKLDNLNTFALLAPGLGGSVREQVAVWTNHFKHQEIFNVMDIKGAFVLSPEVALRDWEVNLHYRYGDDGSDSGPRDALAMYLFVEGEAGMYFFDAQPYYGLRGSQSLVLDFAAGFGFDAAKLSLRASHNTPEILDLMPYARDAWKFQLVLEGLINQQ
jgi:hypothetical protein